MKVEDSCIVVVGAGAAAISCARLYRKLGVKTIYMIDSKGVVHNGRGDLNSYKKEFACDSHLSTHDLFNGAHIVVGLSRPGSFTTEHIALMAPNPAIFTLANPTPELMPDVVREVRPDAIIATGRSDFPNQVNNVLGFPFIFRGALDTQARKINDEMKLAASHALAALTHLEVPEYLNEIYKTKINFGPEYIIPKPFDKRLIVEVSAAVAQAAVETGVARVENFDINAYKTQLATMAQ